MSNMNNLGFNNKAWGPGVGNIGSAMVQFQPPQQQQVFQNPIGLQQQNLVGLQQMANNMNNTLNSQIAANPIFQQVAYPNTRVNTQAFQTGLNTNNSNSGTKQKVFTGKVTQLHENFGLVDDEVIFQIHACVKGQVPLVGDRVLVEASYMPNMHFKWSATRIQVLSSNQPRNSKNFGNSNSYNGGPSSDRNGRKFINKRDRSRDRDRGDDELDRKRRCDGKVKEREKDDRNKSPMRRRSRSPKLRRRSRIVPRYMVQVPRIALDIKEGDALEVRRRYPSLYIPSDFFLTNIRWVDSFPPNKPFALNKHCSFHIMNKDVDPLDENDAILEPSDADYLFSAKVMLMSVPGIDELYQRCCGLAEERDKRDRDSEDRDGDYVHPTRLINFLVGLRGKNETMAIGGPWSPSADGENPDKDPSVLIKTAIRTCKALTGIDLSSCTQWYRFVELYYRRAESTHKGKLIPARVETVVLFLPDVWSCLPTRLEWDSMQVAYKKQLDRILKVDNQDVVADDEAAASSTVGAADEKEEEATDKIEPTHHSKLDTKNMNVNELRNELKARNISNKGLKSQLIARLTKALKAEAEKCEGNENDKKMGEAMEAETSETNILDEKKSEVDEKEKIIDEKEKAILEKRYTLPNHQHVLVHPSKTAKSGKFDCTVMSLSLLLDYRQEDSKEHSFEVSLFAELFNEMLVRDFGFNIYKALYYLPEKPKDKKEKDEKRDKEKDDKDKKKDEKLKSDEAEEKTVEDEKASEGQTNHKIESEEHEKQKEVDKKDKSERDRKDQHKDEKQHDDSDEDDDDDRDRRRDRKGNKKDKKDKVKLYTKDKHLLLSFVYFDQTHCGYIFDKDIEDLLYTLGLKLSRAQIRKLVAKVIVRDSLHYRKLTDKPKEDEVIDDSEKEVDWQKLAIGNKKYMPIFKRNDGSEAGFTKTEPANLQEGFVLFQGSVVDINKLILQLERSENTRLETETRMVTLKTDNQRLQEKYDRSNSTIKRLNSEVRDYREKLRSTEDTLSRISAYSKLYETTLSDIRDKIDPVLKSTSHKEDVKKEKDKDRDEKDRKQEDSKSRWEKEEKIKKEVACDVDVPDL